MLKKNEIINLKIDDIGMNGEGIAHVDGQAVFVPFALVGEVVEAQIIYNKKIVIAKLQKVIESSLHRCEPQCEYYGKCGGCELQHMDYQETLKFKTNLVKSTLQKVGGIDVEVLPCIASQYTYNYRNKAAFPVVADKGNTRIGMFGKNSHNLIEITHCPIQKTFVTKLLKIVNNYIKKFEIQGYDEQKQTGVLKHIVMREINSNIMLTLVVTTPSINGLDYLSKALADNYKYYGLNININNLKNNVILTNNFKHISGLKELNGCEKDVLFGISPLSFYQVNDYIRNLIYCDIINNVDKEKFVIDAYCGAGLLSAMLAKQCKSVIGVEIVKDAVDNANELFVKNNIQNARAICGDCAEVLPKLEISNEKRVSVVLDPPRMGCDEKTLQGVLNINPETIIYLSCSPQTLARDLKILTGTKQYEFISVQPYDMFPQTHHVETLVVLKRMD